jgi:hypothetical protein
MDHKHRPIFPVFYSGTEYMAAAAKTTRILISKEAAAIPAIVLKNEVISCMMIQGAASNMCAFR